MALMSKLTAAYMAGFIDGEGYISILPYKNKKYPERPYYKAIIKIASTDREIIGWIQKSFGGWIHHRTYSNPIYKDAFCWQLGGIKNLKPLLQKIRPHLKIKQKQCDIVLEKFRLQEKVGNENSNTDDIYSKIVELYKEVKILNKRGK